MRFSTGWVGVLAIVCIGCGGPSVDVKASGDSTKMTVQDGKGGTQTIESSGKGDNMVITGKNADGEYKMGGEVTEQDLGLPFYPGSTAIAGAMKVQSAEGNMASSIRTSNDGVDAITDFYKSKLEKPSVSKTDTDGSSMVLMGGKTPAGFEISVTITRGKEDKVTTVSVTSADKSKATK